MKNQKIKLSAIIITKNEEKNIKDCIQSVLFADEIIIIDSKSSDKTVENAKTFGEKIKIFLVDFKDFAEVRNYALARASGDWVLYIDADERVSGELKNAIKQSLKQSKLLAFKLKRKNFYFGNCEWPKMEKMERLFFRKNLKVWHGRLHESPDFNGELGELDGYLLHYTHRNLSSMVEKTNIWSEIEANLLLKSNHPKMVWWRFIRIMITKFWDSFVKQKGYRLGSIGFIESLYQAFSYFIVYAKLWEKQQLNLKVQNSNVKTS